MTHGMDSNLPAWKARAQSFLHVSEKDVRAKCQSGVNSPRSSKSSRLYSLSFLVLGCTSTWYTEVLK